MSTNGKHTAPDWAVTLTAFDLAFGFLSKAFYEAPTADLIRSLADTDAFADWPLDATDRHTQTGLELLREFTAHWSDETLPDLAWDYTRLFIGPGPVLAPPWESVYLSREHLLFDQQTLEVRQAYACYGLQAPRLNSEPDDHLGLELAFLVHLGSLGLNALQAGQLDDLAGHLDAFKAFLKDHLLRWAPQCLGLVIARANTDYYRGIAYLALGSLEQAAALFELPLPTEMRA
jgi:TorA maturation chaperone TorD